MNQTMTVSKINIEDIHIDDDFNCRGFISGAHIIDLKESMRSHGLVQPVVVMEYNEKEIANTNKKYKLIAGYRRTKAAIALGWEQIDAVIKEHMEENESVILNLSENFKRQNLTFSQEAKALGKLENDLGMSKDDIMKHLGVTYGWLQPRMMLLSLPPEIYEDVDAGLIKGTQVRELYSILRKHREQGKLKQGFEKVLSAAKTIKAQAQRGRKNIIVDPDKVRKDIKRVRTRPEILEFNDHLVTVLGQNIGTLALAWAAGEVTLEELEEECKDFGKLINKVYISYEYSPE